MGTPQPELPPSDSLSEKQATSDSDLPAIGSVIAEKFRLDELIGEGGMGAVFAATHLLTSKPVAVKWMLPEVASDRAAVSRFLREARAAGQIDHPNVVDIYDVGTFEDAPFLVMERLKGRSLEELLDGGPVSPATVVRLLLPAMRGIAAAHERGVVHRDLKPDNLFVCEDVRGLPIDTKVLDFGISKIAGDEVSSLTVTGAVMGTPHYMAPEQIRGLNDVDARADVYALGVIIYQALTGELPFVAETFTALAVNIATEPPTPPERYAPDLDPSLCRVLMRTLEKDRDARFQSVAALARALEPFSTGERFSETSGTIRISERPPALEARVSTPTLPGGGVTRETVAARPGALEPHDEPAERSASRSQRKPLFVAIGTAAVIGLVGTAILAWSSSSAEETERSAPSSAASPPAVPTATPTAPSAAAPPRTPADGAEASETVPLAEPPDVATGGATPEPEIEAETPVEPGEPALRTSRARRPARGRRMPANRESRRPASGARGGVRTGGVSLDDF